MKSFLFFLSPIAIVAPAFAAVAPPSPVTATAESWAAFTRQAVAAGDFAGWRDALGERIRVELSPSQEAKAQTPVAALALAQWQFLKDVLGPDANALGAVAAGDGGKEFLEWLLSNREALEDYNGVAGVFRLSKKRTHGLEGWRDIWREYSESREAGLWRRVAVACATAFAEPRPHSTPKERFDFTGRATQRGSWCRILKKALPFELALTVHADGRGNDELEWAQDVTRKTRKPRVVWAATVIRSSATGWIITAARRCRARITTTRSATTSALRWNTAAFVE